MSLPLTLLDRYNVGNYQQKPTNNPAGWRISALGRAAGLMGAYLPSPNLNGYVIGGADVMRLIGSGNTDGSIITSPEGLVHSFPGPTARRFDAGAALLASNPTTATQMSLICRLRYAAPPASAEAYICQMLATPSSIGGGPFISVTTSGFLKVVWASFGGGLVGAATGSTNWAGTGFQTFGASTDANHSGILYENGVRVATGSGAGAGSDGATSAPTFMLSPYVADSLFYDLSWIFFFNKQLSDGEHWFYSRNPWLLIEPINNQLIGVTAAGGGGGASNDNQLMLRGVS